jgi:CheY-like chemotaxis protein
LIHEHGYDPGLLPECVRRCLAQTDDRPAVIVAQVEEVSAEGPGPVSAKTSDLQALVGRCILVVEDEEDSREATCLMLERHGAEVLTAGDGIAALAAVKAEHVDLIACNLDMPRMGGFEFLHALRHLDGHMQPPVVAISGRAGSADHQRIEAAGFAGYIDKPFDDVRLLAAIDDAMARLRPCDLGISAGVRRVL